MKAAIAVPALLFLVQRNSCVLAWTVLGVENKQEPVFVRSTDIDTSYGYYRHNNPKKEPGRVSDGISLLLSLAQQGDQLQEVNVDSQGLSSMSDAFLTGPQTQRQQMSNAMALKTLQGSKWRLSLSIEGASPSEPVTIIFQGFSDQPNKGIVQCSCAGDAREQSALTTRGPWLSKPSEIRRGTVQLSARWKV